MRYTVFTRSRFGWTAITFLAACVLVMFLWRPSNLQCIGPGVLNAPIRVRTNKTLNAPSRVRTNKSTSTCRFVLKRTPVNILELQPPDFIEHHKNPCWYKKNKMYCLPYMYLVGVAKCGTTDLFKRITLHPDFESPIIKETNWLSNGLYFKGDSLEYYASNYFEPLINRLREYKQGVKTNIITGEASINSIQGATVWDQIGKNKGQPEPIEGNPEYIYHLNKNTRILINVRNPVDRLWSEYLAFSRASEKSAAKFHNMAERMVALYRKCFEVSTLRSCVYNRTLSRLASMNSTEVNNYCNVGLPIDIVMLYRGIYHVHIKDFLNVFPRNQVLIQRLEDISENPRASLEKTFRFLGLRQLNKSSMDSIFALEVRNSRKRGDRRAGKMWMRTRNLLYDFYKEHNEELAILLGDDSFDYGLFD